MVSAIFTQLETIISSFATTLVSLFGDVVKIFYTAPSGSNTTGELTIVGILALMGLGTGLVIWAFNFVRRLLELRQNSLNSWL